MASELKLFVELPYRTGLHGENTAHPTRAIRDAVSCDKCGGIGYALDAHSRMHQCDNCGGSGFVDRAFDYHGRPARMFELFKDTAHLQHAWGAHPYYDDTHVQTPHSPQTAWCAPIDAVLRGAGELGPLRETGYLEWLGQILSQSAEARLVWYFAQ